MIHKTFFLIGTFLFLSTSVLKADSASAQANNPLANMKALNFHNYYMGDLTQTDETSNQTWIRYAQPLSVGESNWLIRGSLPINSFPQINGSKKTGLGDFNVFAAYLIDVGNPAVSFGVGPQFTLPTAADNLGSDKYSAGIANVMFDASSRQYQYGYLLTWQHSFAGNSETDTVNTAAFQPFGMYQLGNGTYLRSVGIWYYDIEKDHYSIPIGIGVGQVFKKNNTVYNIFVEPQYSIIDKGSGIVKWQVLLGLNLQFLSD